MQFIQQLSTRALLTGVAALVCAPTMATTIELLPLGDSTTFGVGSDTDGLPTNSNPDDDLGGYRFYLDNLLGAGFEFVGNRSVGTGTSSNFSDNENFGVRGGQAQADGNFGGYAPSLLTGINDSGPGVTSQDAAFNTSVTNPNGAIIQIGINSLPSDGFDFSGPSNANRLEQQVSAAVADFSTFLDGDASRPNGLINRLSDGSFANDAHLFIALIFPRLDGDTSNPNSIERYLNERQGRIVADYNNRIKTEVESRMGPGGELEGRVTFVDLYSIALVELDLQALADEFYAGDLGLLDAAINPDDDAADGGLEYVDWTSMIGFDEGEYDNGTYLSDQDLQEGSSTSPSLLNANTDLLGDGLHPSNLGYAIIAQVYNDAIQTHYIPEPSSMALLLGVGGLLLGRRRRRAWC